MSQSTNPLLAKAKLPGKVFQLPSKGIFYQKGVLADHVQNAEIHVQPMSALAEIKLKSPDLLISGKVLREVCLECVPEILNPEELCVKDVDALFIYLVLSTYGELKTVRAIHDCQKADWHDYQINLLSVVQNPRNEGLKNYKMLYTHTLSNGQILNLKPITFRRSMDMVTIRQSITNREINGQFPDREEIEQLIILDLLSVIDSVEDIYNGEKVHINDPIYLEEWLRTLPKKLTDEIIAASEKSSEWGFDFSSTLVCRDCNEPFKYDLELNPISFFSG